MRLIDADALDDVLEKAQKNLKELNLQSKVLQDIRTFVATRPTIHPPADSCWIDDRVSITTTDGNFHYYHCMNCGAPTWTCGDNKPSDHCNHCGATMHGIMTNGD